MLVMKLGESTSLSIYSVIDICFAESVIIKIWKDMVTGLAIDEQRQLRSEASSYEGHASAAQNSGPSDVPVTPLDVDSDDEQDPNDIVAQPAPNSMAKQAQQMSFEDESDYGEYDSDDDSD